MRFEDTKRQMDVLDAVISERGRQDDKWGEQNHDDSKWLAILMEEVGEVARDILEGNSVEDEITQCAAVAVAWMECIYRRTITASPNVQDDGRIIWHNCGSDGEQVRKLTCPACVEILRSRGAS